MSAFERKRLENIANNNAILNDISTTAVKLETPKPKPKPARSSTPKVKREPIKRESLRVATRQSSRLAGLDASSEVLKRKLEVEAETESEKARAKRNRVSGDLSLGDIKVEGRKWENGLDGMAGLKGLGLYSRGAEPGVRTFAEDDVKETTDKSLKELRMRLSGLKLYEKWPVNGKFPVRSPDEPWSNLPQTSRSRPSECIPLAFIPQKTSRLSLPATRRALSVFSMRPKKPPK